MNNVFTVCDLNDKATGLTCLNVAHHLILVILLLNKILYLVVIGEGHREARKSNYT